MKRLLSVLFITIALSGCQKDVSEPSTNDQMKAAITGQIAYETTAYVEQFWRVVGNAGFDSSIYHVVNRLEANGYIDESEAKSTDRLTYRIEHRPLDQPTWEPVNASLILNGENEPLLSFASNRNMLAINSYSTPKNGLEGEVVMIKAIDDLKDIDVSGKIVFANMHPRRLYNAAVQEGGAIGIFTYNNPSYLQPEKNITSIQFRSIPRDPENKSWCIPLSYAAKEQLEERLAAGTVRAKVKIETKIFDSEELTVVADIKGSELPNERLVFSAHVQEPGANDNATGVGVATEMAAILADMVTKGEFSPKRSISFLWGDEIVSTNRYVKEDSIRAADIKWGISLDMVGENTALTGGSFLIEKMPDPSAIWTRGNDKHTEWGAAEMTLEDMQPHYLNDFVTNTFKSYGESVGWEVNTNPFEGGSDHVPFLRADIPGVLFWHFTDQFYHTDNDRLDKVSKETLRNVGTGALQIAMKLVNGDSQTGSEMIGLVESAASERLKAEYELSVKAIASGKDVESQKEIIMAWAEWYIEALATCSDLETDENVLLPEILKSQTKIRAQSQELLIQLDPKP